MEALDGVYLTLPSVLGALLLENLVSHGLLAFLAYAVFKADGGLRQGQMGP